MKETTDHHVARWWVAVIVLYTLTAAAYGQSSELARTPPMGWNSWNHFHCKVTEEDVRAAADALVSSGMKAAGYVYVNIDDCWQGSRDEKGMIRPNAKFKDMRALADSVHTPSRAGPTKSAFAWPWAPSEAA